ncbi:MAG: PIG-L family deacetylase [Ignavibacteriales bacterium]|nr:MAG: PIG-L family deacetylase [Ignavibacteriales bacterium]
MFIKKIIFSFIIYFIFYSLLTLAQPAKVLNSSELKLALKKLNVLGSVLYIAAHPDDENTAVLSYLSTGKNLITGYLSITRGDGGQNLIGTEQDEMLGIVRTQELLSARRIDGTAQFFTRAIDFGYTKSPEEALEFWGKEETLSDVVWVIRKFRPDIIVTRFPPDGGGHGHHTASAILALEAFKIAGDSTKFPEHLKYLEPWQPKRIFWNTFFPWFQSQNENEDSLIKIDIGEYNPLLGKSYAEISAESRTMHKSQGFGSSGRRGEIINHFKILDGDSVKNNLFEGIDFSWNRVENSDKISKLLTEAERKFNPENPTDILPLLLEAYREMRNHKKSFWLTEKTNELLDVIRSATGLWIEAIAENYSYSPGSKIKINTGVVNRSDYKFTLKELNISYLNNDTVYNIPLPNGEFISKTFSINLPEDINITNPYWLQKEKYKFRYNVNNQELIGKPENDPPLTGHFIFSTPGGDISFSTPVFYRWTDPVEGEKYRPIEVIPGVTISIQNKINLFPSGNDRKIFFTLKNNLDSFAGKVKLNLPSNWIVNPEEISFNLSKPGEEKQFSFTIIPPDQSDEADFSIEVTSGNEIFNREMITINYPHIQTQTIFPPAEGKLIRLEVQDINGTIGYIEGSGDAVPEYLEHLGYTVNKLSDAQLENGLLEYDAIITGIRAYNTRDRLSVLNKKLFDYVFNGGTLIVQYNTSGDLVTEEIAPYPLTISRGRVTDEESPVNFLLPGHRLLNYPNKITQKDFEGWVQERGLYFIDDADPRYEKILSMTDKNEDPLNGGLIYINYGKGVFIYTSLSFFRQLPAGIPGAFRLFINIISAGNHSG